METKPYKILSLDGGGSWALIQAYALGDMFGMETSGHSILRHYDLVAANSGGSIVLGCLCVNMKPSEILDYFLSEEKRKKMFVRRNFSWSSIPPLFDIGIGYKYTTPKKLEGLRNQFNSYNPGVADKSLPEVATNINLVSGPTTAPYTHILIVGFDYHTNRARYFRSNINSLASSSPGVAGAGTLSEAIHASSNAPLNYFDAPAEIVDAATQKKRFYWDGAISGHNNPVGAAVIEALANGKKPGKIYALSIGTGSAVLPHPHLAPTNNTFDQDLYIKTKPYNFTRDILKIAKSIVADPPEMASFKAFIAVGGSVQSPSEGPVIRMSPLVQPIRSSTAQFDYPVFLNYGTSAISPLGRNRNLFNELKELDMDAVKQNEVDLIKILCESWLATNPAETSRCCVYNQPVQARTDLSVNIGHRYYNEAKAVAHTLGLYI